MARRGVLAAIALAALTLAQGSAIAYEETIVDEYWASVGGAVTGQGAALNAGPFGPGRYSASAPATRVDVTATDDSGFAPWLTVCVDLNNNNVCSATDGDVSQSGAGHVAIGVDPALPFRQVQVYAYTLGADPTGAYLATTGTLVVRFTG